MGHEKERTSGHSKTKPERHGREQAEKRTNTGNGGLAKHDETCPNNIRWQESCILQKKTKNKHTKESSWNS